MDFDFVFAAHYSRNLSIRVKEGNKTKLSKGEYIGCPPLGYLYQKGKLIPDPLSAKHIKKAFMLYSTGQYTLKQLTNILYADGLRSRLAKNKVPKASIHTALLNPVYYGVIRRAGMLYKGIHTPLVSKSIFENVQFVLQGKNRSKKRTHEFLYRPFLKCGNCTCQLTASLKKEKYIYYYCTNGKRKCEEHKSYMNQPHIQKLIQELFSIFTLDKEMAELAFDIYATNLKKSYEENGGQREIIQKQIDSIDKKLDKLLDLRLEESIDEDKFKEKQKKLKNERVELEVSLSQIKTDNLDKTLELLENFKNDACSLGEMFKNGDDKVREYLLNSVLWNLGIKEKKILTAQYKRPWVYAKDLHTTRDLKIWLALVEDFRTKNWTDRIKYPELVYKQTIQLLSC